MRKQPKKPTTSKATIATYPMELLVLLVIIMMMLAFGIYRVIYKDLLNDQKQVNPQTQQQPQSDNITWKQVPSQFAMFFGESFINRSHTHVYMPIKFSNQIETAWFILTNVQDTNTLTHFLISQPKLMTLNWSKINTGPVYLYQRVPTFDSIDSLLKNPPAATKLLIDSQLYGHKPYQNLKATVLNESTNLDSFDYILTTFNQSRTEQNVIYYENVIDASTAAPNKNNRLGWQVFVEQASETNPYYIGEPHIGYSQ
jgi:hypothetical protein